MTHPLLKFFVVCNVQLGKNLHEVLLELYSKSLYRSRTGKHFYGTENEIWVGFGSFGNTGKKIGADYEQLSSVVSSCFQGQKQYF